MCAPATFHQNLCARISGGPNPAGSFPMPGTTECLNFPIVLS